MPKKVDHQERRERIAAALMQVAADRGLEAVSLRHVAAEAGVTAGMVQHYFPSKDTMMDFAMSAASARYETRMTRAVGRLGEDPAPRDLIDAMLSTLLPSDEAERADARVALAFMAYAVTRSQTAAALGESNAQMRGFLAEQIRSAQKAGAVSADLDPDRAAAGLFASVEGLAMHVLSAGLSAGEARAALDTHIGLVFA